LIYFALTFFAILLATGQILFKQVALHLPSATKIELIWTLAKDPYFWAAIITYGIATILWIWILQRFPLSQAYAFNALGFIIVPLAGYFIFGEPLTIRIILGSAIIIAGMMLVVSPESA